MASPRNIKNQILELKNQGVGFNEIKRRLKCSSATLSYHLSKGQKAKNYQRTVNRRNKHPYIRKIENFIYGNRSRSNIKKNPTYSWYKLLLSKILGFSITQEGRQVKMNGKRILATTMKVFSVEDVIEKFGEHPKCYLTGKILDIQKPRTYQFDHIIPVSQGGDCTIDNLGLCTKEANEAKGSMTPSEFFDFCRKVLEYQGYKVESPK